MTGLIHELASFITEITDKPVDQDTLSEWVGLLIHGRNLVATMANTKPTRVTFVGGLAYETGQSRPELAGYELETKIIAISATSLAEHLNLFNKRNEQPTPLTSNANLKPHNLYFPVGQFPVLVGSEEQAHAVYDQKIKPLMGDRHQNTFRYDGSDSYELHATRTQLTLGINGNLDFYNDQGFPVPPDELRNIRRGIKLAHRVQD